MQVYMRKHEQRVGSNKNFQAHIIFKSQSPSMFTLKKLPYTDF
jgi:hypothetical protein